MKRRTLLIAVLLALPALALVGWFAVREWPIWHAPAVRWVVPGDDKMMGSCAAAATLGTFNAEPVTDTAQAAITSEQAEETAANVITQHYEDHPAPYSRYGPTLVNATFPDGVRRLAWVYAELLDTGGASLIGKASIVYLDAQTSEPLALITNMSVNDPVMTCGYDPALLTYTPRRLAPLFLLAAYVLVLAIVGVGVMVWRRRRSF